MRKVSLYSVANTRKWNGLSLFRAFGRNPRRSFRPFFYEDKKQCSLLAIKDFFNFGGLKEKSRI
ncbi:hypothetical protein BSK20_04155 [SR1 bacterium human oral taxon HOT-345]|nr:hypothetical protein BSK20_04155 [SR1 bacterium human oral taxon HOT-345]